MTTPRRKTILVVDDEQDVVTYLTALLEDSGYATITARDGAEAVARARADAPDLVTLDITMPSQSGVRAFRELKSDSQLARIPVIIVTGIEGEFEHFISTRRQVPAPEGYLSKPVDQERLLALVRHLLAEDDS
jgi:CheY-like chemotaxis protein